MSEDVKALEEIAALDPTRAAVNMAATKAVSIARSALASLGEKTDV